MQDTAARAATYEDLRSVPAPLVAEILFGELVTDPRGTRAATRIAMALGGPFDIGIDGPGGWVFDAEPELHLGPHVVVPDVTGWRVGRLGKDPNDKPFISVPPDWVCAVLSPSTEKRDRVDKEKICADFGVGHYWLIDPKTRVLEVFALRDGCWVVDSTFSGHDDVRAAPFDAFAFPLGYFLPTSTPPVADVCCLSGSAPLGHESGVIAGVHVREAVHFGVERGKTDASAALGVELDWKRV